MKKHYVHVYNIGQGLCTMLRTEPDGENDYLGIFDCGTLRERNKEDVIERIAEYAHQRGCIDSIVISHQDIDHWSLLLDIIWKCYEIESNKIICHDKFYLNRTRYKTTTYEVTEEGTVECSNVEMGDVYNSNFWVEVDENEVIQRFELFGQFLENRRLGECNFWLRWSNAASEMELEVSIDDIMVEDKDNPGHYINQAYDKLLNVNFEREAFKSGDWHCVREEIEHQEKYKEIEAEIGYNQLFKSHFNRFLDYIREFRFSYNYIHTTLSQPTNFKLQDCHIGKIWLGGDCWEVGYKRLYSILKKLVKIDLVYNVNGFTKVSSDDYGDNIRMCGLMRVNESTICSDDVTTSTFDIDENLVDCISHRAGDITPAIVHNASSLIVEFDTSTEAKSRRIIYPGDATVHVFSDLANALDGPEIFENTFFMAPHHGSLHTNYCDGEQQPFYQLLDKLTGEKTVKLSACVISALGEVFGHPNKKFVYDMRDYVRTDNPTVPPHSVCYFEEGLKRIENETKGIYCTEMMRAIGRRWHSEPPEQANAVRKEQSRLLPGRNAFV